MKTKAFIGFSILTIGLFALTGLLAGCASDGSSAFHDTSIHGNYTGDTNGDNGVASAGVSTGIGDHVTAGIDGTYDVDTGGIGAGFVVTIKQAPSDFALQQFTRAGGKPINATQWVFPKGPGSKDDSDPVSLALKAASAEPGGAHVDRFVVEQPGTIKVSTQAW